MFRAYRIKALACFISLCACGLLATQARAELADTIERIKPSIVAVGTFAVLRSPQFILRGTGFAIGDGRLIATNAHVAPPAGSETEQESLRVLVRSGTEVRQRDARLVLRDAEHDLAILRLEGPPLPALQLQASAKTREGDAIAFTGFPIGGVLGFSPVTHRGIVAAITPIALPGGNAGELKDASIRRLRGGAFSVYQLDATAYPGNSGGPLYDAQTGEVLGIINMVFVKESKEAVLEKPSGISYAIPVRYLTEMLDRLPR